MRSPLYLRGVAIIVAVTVTVALTGLAGCAADPRVAQQQMDERLEWSEAALPLKGTEGFEGAATGALEASAEFVGSVGLASVPPGDHVVHLACRGEGPVEFSITSTDDSDLASTTLDCGGSTAVEVATATEGLVLAAQGESPADWAVAVVRSPVG